jgi:hypothetical protein
MRKRKNQCIVESSTTLTILFNIFTNAGFHCVKIASDEITLRSFGAGFELLIEKFDVLLIEEEQNMFS